jgi:hypothetical protein
VVVAAGGGSNIFAAQSTSTGQSQQVLGWQMPMSNVLLVGTYAALRTK